MHIEVMKTMMNSIDPFDDIPVTRMVYAVLAGNALWFMSLGWAMENARMWNHMWGYPPFKDNADA